MRRYLLTAALIVVALLCHPSVNARGIITKAGSSGGIPGLQTTTLSQFSYTYDNTIISTCNGTSGATLDCNWTILTVPAKARIHSAYHLVTSAAAGPTTLTIAVGRVNPNYIDLLTAQSIKASANTLYGDTAAEVGASLISNGYLTSWTATSAFNIRLLATGANIDTTTTAGGTIVIEYSVFP
jgi:hypothetical protein